MGLVILFTIGLAVTAAYVLYQILTNFPPGKARMQKDLNKLKAEIAPWFEDLVPWSDEEMERLSLNQVNNKVSKGIVSRGKGVFTSIYHEPMIAYAFKKYVGGGDHILLYARTSHHEYAFRIKGKEAQVWMDSEPVGKVRQDGTLVDIRGKKELAKIRRMPDQKLLPVVVNGREVASLVDPQKADTVNPRALELLTPMETDEEGVFLSLAILEMVRQKLP